MLSEIYEMNILLRKFRRNTKKIENENGEYKELVRANMLIINEIKSLAKRLDTQAYEFSLKPTFSPEQEERLQIARKLKEDMSK